MRQLLPEPVADVDPLVVHTDLPRPAPPGRPHVLVNMIASVDGATATADAVSGGLGGAGDRAVFSALRSLADVILVASRTANAERYRSPRADEAVRAARTARGQAPLPRVAVVTGRLSVDLSLGLFTDPGDERPMVITAASAPANRRDEVEAMAEVVEAGTDVVDLGAALTLLHDRGARVVLCEGGPSLNGSLADLDLVDEWCLTVSPTIAGGDSHRICAGAAPELRGLELERVLEHDGALFLRYLRPR